jgi:hypothetical protein
MNKKIKLKSKLLKKMTKNIKMSKTQEELIKNMSKFLLIYKLK